ncbi:MAG: GTP-binding protein [Candidatus Paceibacteria bacterium]|jgi:GTP-binding protein
MKTIIKNATFIKGVVGEDAVMYDGTPHIAFIGRSNVGKSSTVNAVLGRNKLVKVGNTPGKTREINFFDVTTSENQHCYLVDLPGYGYAKLSKTDRKKLKDLIEWYIVHPEADTALVCLIIDSKVGLTGADKEFIHLMDQANKQYVIASNKIDKINQKAQNQLRKDLVEQVRPGTQIFYYSATKGKNIHLLQQHLFKTEDKES